MERILSVQNLRQIRGIGPSIEEKLITAFGTEKAVLNALRESRIAEISSIEGIGERFALSLCRNLHYQETGEQLQNFIKTDDAILLYNRIIEIISKFANTSYSRSKLYLFFPLPISEFEKIKKRQKNTQLAHHLATLIKKTPHTFKEYDAFLRNLSPLKEQTGYLDTASRVVATTDKQIYNEVSSNEIGKHCEILFIEDIEQIAEYFAGHDEIIWIGSDVLLDEGFPNIITVSESQRNDLTQIIPEKTLSFFAKNKKTLQAISGVVRLLKSIPPEGLTPFIGNLDLEKLLELGKELDNLEESGEPTEELNEDYARLLKAETAFDSKLDDVLLELNEKLEHKLHDTTVQLGGEKILALLKGMSDDEHGYRGEGGRADLREYLDEELYLSVEELISQAEEKLIKILFLKDEETEFITGIFPRELRYPIDAVEDVSSRMKTFLRQRRAVKAFELKVKLAKSLKQFEKISIEALNYMLELDYLLMIAKFSSAYNLVLPELREGEQTGLIFESGENLFLAQQALRGSLKVCPISYAIGEVGKIEGVIKGERIILLSGANSGGKTTLLVSIGIIVILGQMGLPVPCEKARLAGFQEFHYYRKSSGQMDAGAFESTLRTLSQMIISPNSRLVLADEMESISEPGASARVIAAFLDLLARSPHSVGIFVTHLAQEIAKYSKEEIRIDGIEARGLSEDLELLVNRTPVYYKYAKSTPELIVRRLEQISSGKEKEIYSYILRAFDGN